MKCPYCGEVDKDKVLDSRPVRDNSAIKRRRECAGCGRRFTTFEQIEELQLTVVKKDGTRQSFDRNKLCASLRTALKKRPVSAVVLDEVVDDIERTLTNRLDKEVPSHEVGELVMEHLKRIDQVAYVRFASVYRQFEDATQFRDIVNILRRKGGRVRTKE
jgi:transcriptional repressor NrdR